MAEATGRWVAFRGGLLGVPPCASLCSYVPAGVLLTHPCHVRLSADGPKDTPKEFAMKDTLNA